MQNLFGSYGIEWVEWLNGECVNVLFKDAAKAEKAMQDISEPIPVVEGTPCATLLQWARTVGASCVLIAWCTACSPGVQRVHPQWRHCVKLLVKSKSDSYGPAGKCSPVQHQHAAGFCTGLTCNGMCGSRFPDQGVPSLCHRP